MNPQCTVSGQDFPITQEEKAFRENIGVELPTLCPDERQRRRASWRNERILYKRTCDATGKSVISIYHPDQPFPVYDQHYWWGDEWDSTEYGMDFDFDRPFFEQFAELLQKVPRISIINKQGQNSDYCNYSQKNKNCYLTFGSHFNEDLLYVHYSSRSTSCSDCFWVHDCELCYECVDCTRGYNLRYSQNSHSCSDSWFLKNCVGCKNCFGCVNLHQKQYYFLNQPCTKEAYEQKLASLKLHSYKSIQEYRTQFQEFIKQFPHRYMEGVQYESVAGDYIKHSRNCYDCFEMHTCEDCRYSYVCDETYNSLDVSHMGYDRSEVCYEMIGCSGNFDCKVCESCWHTSNTDYCSLCFHSQNLFGCIGMRQKKYCILNKQYTEEAYKALREKIIAHMQDTGEWGEFFPTKFSPFAYNETVCMRYFPLSQEEAQTQGFQWKLEDPKQINGHSPTQFPDNISDVDDRICEQALICEMTGKTYQIIPKELQFYRDMQLPVPHLCPDERNRRREQMRNPQILYARTCAECDKSIQTTYAPDRPEKVLCESCYLKVIN